MDKTILAQLPTDPVALDRPLTDEESTAIEDFKKLDWTDVEEKPDAEEENDQKKDADQDEEKKGEEGDSEKKSEDPGEETKPPEESEEAILQKIAEEEKCTIDEAKEVLAKDKSIVERHGSDPVKIARALRKEQSVYGKIKAELDDLKAYKEQTEKAQREYQEKHIDSQLQSQKDSIIEKYLKLHPEDEDLHDDVVFEKAKVQIKEIIKKQTEEQKAKLADQASKTIVSLVESIPDEYKDVIPEVKQALQEVDHADVVDPKFDVMSVVFWARGKKYSPEYVKSLEDAAYKRGKEEPEIKQKRSIDSSSRSASGKKTSGNATEADVQRAREMFGNKEGWTEEQMVEAYMRDHKGKDFWDKPSDTKRR